MLTYGYYCTVCKKGTISRQVWLRHLLEEPHQSLARAECVDWGEESKERCLIAYCSIPVETGVGESGEFLLQMLSTDKALVSDFVWSPDNPTIAVVQLESKKAVSNIISLKGTDLAVTQSCQVKLRRGLDLVDYQWTFMLASIKVMRRGQALPSSYVGASKRGLESNDDMSAISGNAGNDTSSPSALNPIATSSKSCAATSRSFPSVSIKFPVEGSVSLYNQLNSIREALQVPENQYNAAQNIVSVLQTFTDSVQTGVPRCTVHIFRNWHLKIRQDYGDYLLLYVTKRIPNKAATRNAELPWKSGKITRQKARKLILSSGLNVTEVPNPTRDRIRFGLGLRFRFSSGFTVNIITCDNFLIEAQMGRLLGYMCTFDERCIPLLCLVHHWAKSHKITLHENNSLLLNHCTFHCIGEPAALEWMVMLFMCREGMVPTPREIQSRPHRPVPLPKQDVDIGFTDDPNYASDWKASHASVGEESQEEFAFSVVKLAQQFFSFYGNVLASGSWILNTRDGQLLSTFDLLSKGERIPPNTACYSDNTNLLLTHDEMKILRNIHACGGRGIKDQVLFEDSSRFRIYVANPLYIRWRLSLCNDKFPRICDAMMKTAQNLFQFLKIWEEGGIDDVCLSSYL